MDTLCPGAHLRTGNKRALCVLLLIRAEAMNMNRIREFREERRLSRRELGELMGASYKTVERLEETERAISTKWLAKLAEIFDCSMADLLVGGITAETEPDAALAVPGPGAPRVSAAAMRRGRLYCVLTDVLAETGLRIGHHILVDETESAISERRAGDTLLLRVKTPNILILRQFIPPALLTTNRFGPHNTTLKLYDRTVGLGIVGVMSIAFANDEQSAIPR